MTRITNDLTMNTVGFTMNSVCVIMNTVDLIINTVDFTINIIHLTLNTVDLTMNIVQYTMNTVACDLLSTSRGGPVRQLPGLPDCCQKTRKQNSLRFFLSPLRKYDQFRASGRPAPRGPVGHLRGWGAFRPPPGAPIFWLFLGTTFV